MNSSDYAIISILSAIGIFIIGYGVGYWECKNKK